MQERDASVCACVRVHACVEWQEGVGEGSGDVECSSRSSNGN